jgi:hypothetical protein
MNPVRRKLKTAFATLRRQGYYTAGPNICCQTCGLAEVPDSQADAYVFYHIQDAMGLDQNGSCCLAWAGDAILIIGALEAAGLAAKWDSNPRKRIEVSDGADVCPGRRESPCIGAGCSLGAVQ